MRIWIDLANSPHVPFFRALIPEFNKRGHEVELTARDFAETVALTKAAGLKFAVVGGHGGRELAGKAGNLVKRARALWSWARSRRLDLAVSHNSYSQILGARALGLKSVTLMDYEHQPANHLAFRLANRIIVPREFPQDLLDRFGARPAKVRRYKGTKEDVYLADFQPDPSFAVELGKLGIARDDILVVVRPPAREALYHRFENALFDALMRRLTHHAAVKIVLLPRNNLQRTRYAALANRNLILPLAPLDGANLIAASDLVISAGGTMNREAATLGVPAATIYAGKWAAVDEELVRQGRLQRISNRAELDNLPFAKKSPKSNVQSPTSANPQGALNVRMEVADLILEGW